MGMRRERNVELPTLNAEVLVVDLDDGTLVEKIKTDG